jgi:hypothetical protein
VQSTNIYLTGSSRGIGAVSIKNGAEFMQLPG